MSTPSEILRERINREVWPQHVVKNRRCCARLRRADHVINEWHEVRYWHKADIPIALRNVR